MRFAKQLALQLPSATGTSTPACRLSLQCCVSHGSSTLCVLALPSPCHRCRHQWHHQLSQQDQLTGGPTCRRACLHHGSWCGSPWCRTCRPVSGCQSRCCRPASVDVACDGRAAAGAGCMDAPEAHHSYSRTSAPAELIIPSCSRTVTAWLHHHHHAHGGHRAGWMGLLSSQISCLLRFLTVAY